MGVEVRTVEQKIERLASRSHGVVTRARLLAAGITSKEIQRRVEVGLLLPVYRGVYRVGHRAPSTEARYLAAVLACGHVAVLSGRAAAYHLQLIKGPPPPPEVTTRTERRVPGVRTRRSRGLAEIDGMRWQGIPTTTVPRTLVDLAATLSLDALSRACHEAGVRHRTTPASVVGALSRYPNAPGRWNLEEVMGRRTRVSLSRLESKFLARLRAAQLRLPDETNRPAGAHRVDCRWRQPPLTVELDSYRYHHTRHAWEQDRRRDRDAYARGDEIRRYTYGDVFEDPGPMLAELAALLG